MTPREIQIVRTIIKTGAAVCVMIVFFYSLRIAWLVVAMPDCMFPKTVKEVHGLQGLDFNVTMSDCLFIGSSWEINVNASEGGNLNKAIIFVYEPEFPPPEYAPTTPEFHISGSGVITISVMSVSSIDLQLDEWNGHRIAYKIGHIEYPASLRQETTHQ